MPMADIKGPSFVGRSPASSRRSTLRSSSDPTPPKGSWCCPNAGWWKEPWRGSGDAAGWPRTGNASTTRRAHSCSSPRSALWSEGYAAPSYVSGQTLRFEPDRVMYDDSERMIRIFALDGLQLVRCAVSKAALVALEDDALGGPYAMAITYQRNRSLVQEIARRKYAARRFEGGDTIVVRLNDINAQLATSRAA